METAFFPLSGLDQFNHFISQTAALVCFGAVNCHVCTALKPKIEELIRDEFPLIACGYVNVNEDARLSAHLHIFTVPVVLVFFEGREFIRKARGFGLHELRREMVRPYELLFNGPSGHIPVP